MGFLYVPGDPGAQMVGFHKVLRDAVFVKKSVVSFVSFKTMRFHKVL